MTALSLVHNFAKY